MRKKSILLTFVIMLLGSAVVWFHHNRLTEQPQNLQPIEPETTATVIEKITSNESAPSTEPSDQQSHKTILVKNGITDKMITYKKGFINYIPEFKVVVNGASLAQGEQQSIKAPDKILKVTYSYDFVNGYKTGTRTVLFTIPENLTEVTITFDWKNDWRVLVDGAEPFEIIE